jgi:hypothetical protein
MAVDLEKELRDLKRRVDFAETRLSQLEGQIGFISGQLRDIQLYIHARFDDLDGKFDGVAGKVDDLRNDLPQIVASAVTDVEAMWFAGGSHPKSQVRVSGNPVN